MTDQLFRLKSGDCIDGESNIVLLIIDSILLEVNIA
jgi:hypothetical protein